MQRCGRGVKTTASDCVVHFNNPQANASQKLAKYKFSPHTTFSRCLTVYSTPDPLSVTHLALHSISTTKYNLLTFFPKNLFEQFHRVANIYFLIIGENSFPTALTRIRIRTLTTFPSDSEFHPCSWSLLQGCFRHSSFFRVDRYCSERFLRRSPARKI